MKEIPILFSTPMVQAILEGQKTMTRRIVKYKKEITNPEVGWTTFTDEGQFSVRGIHSSGEYGESFFKMPYQKGNLLWVRETHMYVGKPNIEYIYKCGYPQNLHPDIINIPSAKCIGWKPSIHMPKAAARIWLQVEEIRVERLQDISEEDARAEGVQRYFNDLFQEERYFDYAKAKPGQFKNERFRYSGRKRMEGSNFFL